ncbi:MAG: DUF2235 domain-containing protein [Rhodobacteraceae bacterium]|nr:DUF2235 domain-containing protein [Paracoccaceae bacterium]
MRLNRLLRQLLGRELAARAHGAEPRRRGRVDHVIVLDGTMSSLEEGAETNAGLTYRLLAERGRVAGLSLYYEAGIQWEEWRRAPDVIMGRGINRQIRRAYGFLASRYRPGDRIFLFGFSRGAYAVRSLAGVIDRVGLLRAEHATTRAVREVYRHYELAPESEAARLFAGLYCHPSVEIEMVGVWDTVKALGMRLPLLWMLTEKRHAFHDHRLGASVRHGFHALALDETREVYAPVLWSSGDRRLPGQVIEQVWFRGAHGDIGGHLGGFDAARPLANIPLVWMLEKAEGCGLVLPTGWRARFPRDPEAPSVGTWRGWGKTFLIRRRRRVGLDPSESIHPTAIATHPHLTLADAG